jgi:type II secretory ATPase GspE/PulE/Tfp pilus assembly ATPase PilB-like protein
MAPREEIEQAIRVHYKNESGSREAQPLSRVIRVDARKFDADRDGSQLDELDSSIVRLVNKIVTDAHAVGASDIHVDASSGTQQVSVRFRTDGELSEYTRLPGNLRAAIATRIKTMAGIDIFERRRPQEGRIGAIDNGPANLQLRVITLPTCDGNEDIAIKLVPTRELLPLDKLGMSTEVEESVKQLAALPEGLLLIAGPAANGTTTTAYAALDLVNAADRKIWTVESPVEATRNAWSQIEANAKIGWDYNSIMETVVRADPDVVMVGEMRNRETVALAVETALNHSLVVAAMRGNSAPQAIARLLDMGVDAFSLADVIVGVIAQRLARRLCGSCRISRPLTPSELEGLIQEYCQGTQLRPTQVRVEWTQRFGSALEIHGAKGCELCGGTGYHGHIGLYELLRAGPAMHALIMQRRPANELAAAAMQGGMRTLKQDGIDKALAGLSDMREIRAVTV